MSRAPRIHGEDSTGRPARPAQGVAPRGVARPHADPGRKPHALAHTRQTPQAPPVYRPQAAPRVLQTKAAGASADANTNTNANANSNVNTPRHAPQTPSRARPSTPAAQPKVGVPRAHASAAPKQSAPLSPHAASRMPVVQRTAARTPRASVVQATKLYPNLHPGAVERTEPDSIFRLSSFAEQYRLRKAQSHGVYVPNQLYNFVRTSSGEMLLHNRYRHPSIAEGRQVLYAGEVFFNNGRLEWWSNGSGHYQPDSEDAQQAALPMDQFFSYQQIIKGEHKQRKHAGR